MARLPGVTCKSVKNGGRVALGNIFHTMKRHQRKRGHPDPGAKIVALSPDQLKDNGWFPCELCDEGFECEQNLLVHARSHRVVSRIRKKSRLGLWSSSQKKAYICPVTTCRYHDHRRALSDVTAIKKHYGRKHCSKKLACTRCNKKYAIAADLKAHFKLHLKDDGAGSSNPAAASAHRRTKRDVAGVATAGANVRSYGSTHNDDISRSLGLGERQEAYMPQFGLAPGNDGRERGQPAMNASASLDMDLDLMGHLPMGLTGLLAGRRPSLGHPEAPIAAAYYAPMAAPFADPTPVAKSPPTNYAPILSQAEDLQTPHIFMPPSRDDHSFAAGVRSRRGMSTPNHQFSSFAPFFGSGAVPMYTGGHSMGGGPSDGFEGFFVGSANQNQGSWKRGTDGVGSFSLDVPPVRASQQQPVAAAPGFSYASMLDDVAGAAAAASEMDQPWLDLRLRCPAPPSPPRSAAPNQRGNGSVPVLINFLGGK